MSYYDYYYYYHDVTYRLNVVVNMGRLTGPLTASTLEKEKRTYSKETFIMGDRAGVKRHVLRETNLSCCLSPSVDISHSLI